MPKSLLTVLLPGEATPPLILYEDYMVLAPGVDTDERQKVIGLLVEALGICCPPSPRHAKPSLQIVR